MHLDLRQMFGNRMGLDAIMPNMSDPRARFEPLWTFKLMTDRRYMQFNGTVDFLNWDPNGRFVYIGVVRQVEHVYLVLVPKECMGDDVKASGAPSYKHIQPMDARAVRAHRPASPCASA